MAPFPLRARTDADLPGVAALLLATHRSDAYPVIAVDLEAWGAATDVIRAWVAVDPADGTIVGHGVLTEAHDDEATRQWESATGRPRRELAVVRRLVVHRRAQGTGLGRALLETAVDAAHALGRRPVLDMASNLLAAARLYRAAGFEEIGAYDIDLTEHLPAGVDDIEIAGTRTHHLHVLTWVGPEAAG